MYSNQYSVDSSEPQKGMTVNNFEIKIIAFLKRLLWNLST
jgi:hypothetical protein